jgi:hypothetical protein
MNQHEKRRVARQQGAGNFLDTLYFCPVYGNLLLIDTAEVPELRLRDVVPGTGDTARECSAAFVGPSHDSIGNKINAKCGHSEAFMNEVQI